MSIEEKIDRLFVDVINDILYNITADDIDEKILEKHGIYNEMDVVEAKKELLEAIHETMFEPSDE